MNKFCLLFFILAIFVLSSCKESQQKRSEKIVSEWKDREIIIPDNITFKSLRQDTLCTYLWDKPYKIFTYIDSIGCTACNMNLYGWKGIIQLCKQEQFDVGFIFAVHSSNYNSFDADIVMYSFDYPIIYDYNNDFDKLNNFPPAPYRTFLLDKDNKVLLVGSPIGNIEMWEKYKSSFQFSVFSFQK
ncbi:MAG: hypothetical protein FWH18_09170 [Marinilabiliaceae bacterium]|nr:hypothetical protein [Marinilabiliaceae bacterium]